MEGTRHKWILLLGGHAHEGAGVPGFQPQFVWNQVLWPESKSWDTLPGSVPVPLPLCMACGRSASTQHLSDLVSCESPPGFRNQDDDLGDIMFKNHRDIYRQVPGGTGLLSTALCSPGSLGCSETCFSFQSWEEATYFKKNGRNCNALTPQD